MSNNFKKFRFILFVAVLLPWTVFAAPAINSVEGEIVSGSAVTISGSGFGAKTQAAPIKWDNFDNGTVGQDIQGYSYLVAGGARVRPKYTTDRFFGIEGKAALGDCSGQQYDCGYYLTNVNKRKVYLSYNVYVDNTAGSTSRNVKLARFTSADFDTVHGDLGFGYTAFYANTLGASANGGTFYTYNGRGSDDSANTLWFSIPRGQWIRIEMYGTLSDPDIANGTRAMWVDKQTKSYSNSVVTQSSESASTFYRNLIMPFYVAHDINDGTGTYINRLSDYKLYTDDLYFDDTLSRVELCDSVTWPSGASVATCHIQIPISWSDTSTSISLNSGTFTSGQTAYLYIIDSDGNVNANGYAVTIGGLSTPPEPPPPPKTGDLNNDNIVDIFDYNILLGNFSRTGSGIMGDIDSNGRVDIFDYNLLVGNFGR